MAVGGAAADRLRASPASASRSHPVTGRLDRLVIDANYGLGESVVAGECEVDHFELDKKTLAIVERTHRPQGPHDRGHAPAAWKSVPCPPAQADGPCLSDEQVQAVARLLQQVEAHYGWPQDIEWGWREAKLYQFQSRPVTTIQPRWTRDESAERFPLPMTPLTWDFIRVAFKSSMTHSLALMGLPPLQGRLVRADRQPRLRQPERGRADRLRIGRCSRAAFRS